MRTYLALKQRAQEFRADPDVQEALERAGVAARREPTLAPGPLVSYGDLLADRSAGEDYNADAAGARGYAFVALQQLAVEHLMGVR